MRFQNTQVYGFEAAIRGMRNPLESWAKGDSNTICCVADNGDGYTNKFILGNNDLTLAQRLTKAGPEHRKFLRYIHVSCDMTAPLYVWKQFDTYKIGTVANSTSTMHKLSTTPITLGCFETDDYDQEIATIGGLNVANSIIFYCEHLRQAYLETKDKKYWKELIRWLPESWLQTRTIDLNYEVLRNIVQQRANHKLTEWHTFVNWVHTLPYADELIFYEN